MSIECRICHVILDDSNCVFIGNGLKRRICKKCRSKQVMEYNKNLGKIRRDKINEWARKTGRVKEYPCFTCTKPCYKKYAKAFCSDQCRFLSYVDSSGECWIWSGSKKRRGYGAFSIMSKGFKQISAHRASYILFKGDIPEDKLVCHSCDTPQCVKPSHLWIGSTQDNTRDMMEKGRSLYGEKHNKAKITLEGIIKIRTLAQEKIPQRKIASLFNISTGHVNNIIKRRVWKHI